MNELYHKIDLLLQRHDWSKPTDIVYMGVDGTPYLTPYANDEDNYNGSIRVPDRIMIDMLAGALVQVFNCRHVNGGWHMHRFVWSTESNDYVEEQKCFLYDGNMLESLYKGCLWVQETLECL